MFKTIVLSFAAIFVALQVMAATQADKTNDPDVYQQMELFADVYSIVKRAYVDEKTDKELIDAAIAGMISSLDPHSSFMGIEDYEELQVNTSGKFGGLGIQVTMSEEGFVKVISPIDDTPAARAGMKSQDLIVALDGKPVKGLTLDQAVDIMRGDIGTEIVLSVVRDGGQPFEVKIVRASINLITARSELLDDNIGYLRISSFSSNTGELLLKEIDKLKTEAGDEKIIGYVLDLRNNPGGVLQAAIAVSDAFLGAVEVVSTRGRNQGDVRRYTAEEGEAVDGAPLVVLINGGSASASEIVAGAIKDHRRGVLLGTTTFGKGSVQTIMDLQDLGAMRLTTQRYYTPSGVSIQAKGVEPDIYIEQSKVESIEKGVFRKESELEGALDTAKESEEAEQDQTDETNSDDLNSDENGIDVQGDQSDAQDSKANEEQQLDEEGNPVAAEEEQEEEFFDYQLERAKDVLRGYSLLSSVLHS